MTSIVDQACILVGGKGTRLGNLTQDTPKPLLEITENVRFIDIIIDQISRQGFKDILLLAGHLGSTVHERYHRRTVRSSSVSVIIEPEPRGTGGALRAVRDRLAPRFVLLNGDSFFDINVRSLASEPCEHEALIALAEVSDSTRYGSVELRGDQIRSFREKNAGIVGPALINAGIYILRASIVERMDSFPCSLENDLFPAMAAEGKLCGVVRSGYFIDIGVPDSLRRAREELPGVYTRPAAFVDRDGVLNADDGYVYRHDQIKWIPGAPETVRLLNDRGYRVVVVTNQAGVAHGYYQESDVKSLHSWMQEELGKWGAFIDAFYYCPFHPNAKVQEYRADHPDRKPGCGLILKALSDLNIRKSGSFLIGDKDIDIIAAEKAGIAGFLFPGGNLAEFAVQCIDKFKAGAFCGAWSNSHPKKRAPV